MASPNGIDRQKAAQISTLLAGLAAQYHRPDFTEGQAKLLFRDFIDDLHEFSIYSVEAAVRAYRRDPKNKFFPTSGQLRDLAAKHVKEVAEGNRPQRALPKDPRPDFWWLQSVWRTHWRESEIPIDHVRKFETIKANRGEPKRMNW